MRLVGRIIVVCLAVIGILAVLLAGTGVYVAAKAARPQPLPSHMVLMLDLDGGLAETDAAGPLARLQGHTPLLLKDLVQTLDRAAGDNRVAGVVARMGGGSFSMAQAQELRDAISSFRKSGKRAAVFAESLGEGGAATVPYYAASAFGELWLQPSGEVGMTGFMAQSPFFKDALDMLGVKPEFGARWEYKSAIEIFTQKQFSKEAKGSLQFLVETWARQAVEGIASARGLSADQVTKLIDRAPLLADEAREGGLVDRLGYWDELEKSLTEGGAKIVDVTDYGDQLRPESTAVKVALIYGVGPVQSRDGNGSPLENDAVFSADRVTKAFRDAVKDPEIKAILFRIDSPGGSYTASDAIWREVVNARAAQKPVVVSMGGVAASGGYFAAMAADRVIAEPGTITGSIGVFTGKLVLTDLWKKLGVNWDEVHSGQNAGIWSENRAFSPAEWARVNSILDHIYADFTGKAAKARHLDANAMDAIARGRIWPGDKAKEIGLVDELGGLPTALAAVRQLARLPTQNPIDLVPFPKPKNPLDYLLEVVRNGHAPQEMAQMAKLQRILTTLLPFAEMVGSSHSELRMSPLETK